MSKFTTLKMAAIGAVLLAAPMFAQTSARIHVAVPFAFHVGEQVLPAGNYTMRADACSSLMLIRNIETGKTALTVTMPDPTGPLAAGTEVRFRVYGKSRFLSGIRIPGTSNIALTHSPAERELAKNTSPNEIAMVSLRLR